MPKDPKTIGAFVVDAVSQAPKHLESIYNFVLGFRPATARETIRARISEALQRGVVVRVAPGVYFARNGPPVCL